MRDAHVTAAEPVEAAEGHPADDHLADEDLEVVSGGFLAGDVLSAPVAGCFESDGRTQNCMFS